MQKIILIMIIGGVWGVITFVQMGWVCKSAVWPRINHKNPEK